MDSETRSCIELFVADVALEVLCLLMLDQDLFVIEFPITVPNGMLKREEREVPSHQLQGNKKLHITLTLTNTKVWMVSSSFGP